MRIKNIFNILSKKRMECPICIEKITTSRKVQCNYCDYTVCTKCTQIYLTSSADDANCMNCKTLWNRDTILSLLPKTWVNGTYKNHRENVLLERETAMMPSTQPYVEQEIQRRKNLELLTQLKDEQQKVKKKWDELNQLIFSVQNNSNVPLQSENRRSFIHKCADAECKGFLSSAWKCNICEKYTCHECNGLRGLFRDDDHVCDPNEKLTFQMIKSDSKKCPGCAEFIFKVDGCDQMWCTKCHTAFSWRTGQIVNGTIHNPHFYEFQRAHNKLGRDIGDIPCGGIPAYRNIAFALQSFKKELVYKNILDMHRILIHIEQAEIPRYNIVRTERTNLDLRVKYMLNEITTNAFATKIQQREKAFSKKKDIGDLLNMFVTVFSDFLRDIIDRKSIHHLIDEIDALVNYYNESMISVAKRYDCVVPVICDFNLKSSNRHCDNFSILSQ